MPLYEYECTACGHRFEVIQKFSDPPVDKCPQCGQAVERLISSPAIQFKGTGWYVTDYARRNTQSDAKSEPKSEKETAKQAPVVSSDKGEKAKRATTPPPTSSTSK